MTDLDIIKKLENELEITLVYSEHENVKCRYETEKIELKEEIVIALKITYKKLAKIPADIFSLKDLRSLELSNNQITEIPKEISKLEKLEKLNFHNNQITEIPKEINKLKNLKDLFLNGNQISEIPKEVFELENLSYLDLSNNQISEIPKENFELENLSYLDLSNNKIRVLSKNILGYRLIFNKKDASQFKSSMHINLEKNNIKYPKLELLKENPTEEVIKNYYDFLEKNNVSTNSLFKNKEQILPTCIKNINFDLQGINGYINIEKIPVDTHWIFFTGNNGFGKTSILREIANSLYDNNIEFKDKYQNSKGIYIELKDQNHSHINMVGNKYFVKHNNFVAYGTYRAKLHPTADKIDVTDNLFGKSDYVLNFEQRFKEMWAFPELKEEIKLITAILKELLPNLADIKVEKDKETKGTIVYYYEKDESNELLPKVTFNQLAMGMRSIIGLVTDMIFRLSKNQEINNEMQGIAIIDEFDNHLHPKWQKKLVEKLTKIFPKIQFIVSTHSPIPLLGAPANSLVINVDRNKKNGITAEKLDIDFSTLTPNSILSSPIFGFTEIISSKNKDLSKLRTEDDYDEILFNKEIEKRINDFMLEAEKI